MNMKNNKGFTLIEMMITVAILGIISAIAIPSYAEYVRKGKRADAKVELLKIAQLQESYFVQNLSYASTLAQLGLTGTVTSEQGVYEMSVEATPSTCTGVSGANACNGFTLTAEALGAQANDKCEDFTLSNTGVKGRSGTGETVQGCWR